MDTSFLSGIISDEKLQAVEKALLDTFGDIIPADVTSIKGGLSGSLVYKIAMDSQSYILKIDKNSGPLPMENSFDCIEIASQAGVAPKVYYLNKSDGISITAFINHVPLRAVYNSTDLLLSNLAETIRQIHQMPLFKKGKNLHGVVNTLVTAFRNSGMLRNQVLDECFEHFEKILKYYPWNDSDNVSSHNDLNPSNITCDGQRIWIIDWDMASQSDRYVDLAVTANFFIHTEAEEKCFLGHYFKEALDEYKMARFFLMRQTCRIIYAIMMFQLADKLIPEGEVHSNDMHAPDLKEIGERMRSGTMQISSYEGQMIFGKAMINEALKNLRSPAFNLSLAMMNR